MRFVRATRLAAVLGFALASGLHAQHGTGHAGSAGSHSASSVQRNTVSPSSGPNLGGRPYPIRTDIPTPVGLNSPASAYTGILPGAYRIGSGYSRGSRFYGGFVAPPLYLPYLDTGFSSFPGYENSAPPIDPNAQAMADSQEVLAQQVQQLAAEIQNMKSNGQQQQQPMPVVSAAPEHRPPTPPVILVLRDGQQISVESYAVMNQMFWNFSKRPIQKIPIANIDIAASAKATEANGGEFPQLSSAQ